jgi:hypothetical protein
MNTKLIHALCLCLGLLVSSLAFTSCSDSDGFVADQFSLLSGQEQLQEIKSVVNSYAEVAAVFNDANVDYYIAVADADEAHAMVEKFSFTTWDGHDATVKLNDNCGTIQISPLSEEHKFATMQFNLSGYTTVQVTFCTQAFIDSDNGRKFPGDSIALPQVMVIRLP